jgi:hypothetical protein
MGSPRASRPPSVGLGTRLAHSLLVGCVLVTLAVAIQKMFLNGPPPSRETSVESSAVALVRSSSRPASRPAADDIGSSLDEEEADLATATKRVPAQRERSSVASSRGAGNDPITADPPSRGWFNPLPAVARLFSSGEGAGGAAAPDAVTAGGATPSTTASAPASAGASGGGGPQVREVFFGTTAGSACQPGPREFLLADLGELYVCVIWSGLAGAYAEELSFLTQDGRLYQNLPVPFVTAGVPAPAGGIEMRGRHLPAVQAGGGANGETLVVARLPVGGTPISQYRMTGLWTVKVALNGQTLAQDTFDLLP